MKTIGNTERVAYARRSWKRILCGTYRTSLEKRKKALPSCAGDKEKVEWIQN